MKARELANLGVPRGEAIRLAVEACSSATKAVEEYRHWLAAGVPVGPHLADQLLVPMAVAGGKLRTVAPTLHTTTDFEVIKEFLDMRVEIVEHSDRTWTIEANPRDRSALQ